jgi:hypothetical protein
MISHSYLHIHQNIMQLMPYRSELIALLLSFRVHSRCTIEDVVFHRLAIKINSTSAIVTPPNVLLLRNHSWRQSKDKLRTKFKNSNPVLEAALIIARRLHQCQCLDLLAGLWISKTLNLSMDPKACAHFLERNNILRPNNIETFTIRTLSLRDTKVWCRVNTTTKQQIQSEKKFCFPTQRATLRSLKDKERPC